jgi:hypothetical protein
MRTHDHVPRAAGTELEPPAPAAREAADPFAEAGAARSGPRVRELLGVAQEASRGMLEAEDALGVLRERFEQVEDPGAQGDLADEALGEVERQLSLTRGRRHQLDSIEGRLWARRNRLERFLIHTRGLDWWHARRAQGQPQALAREQGESAGGVDRGRAQRLSGTASG